MSAFFTLLCFFNGCTRGSQDEDQNEYVDPHSFLLFDSEAQLEICRAIDHSSDLLQLFKNKQVPYYMRVSFADYETLSLVDLSVEVYLYGRYVLYLNGDFSMVKEGDSVEIENLVFHDLVMAEVSSIKYQDMRAQISYGNSQKRDIAPRDIESLIESNLNFAEVLRMEILQDDPVEYFAAAHLAGCEDQQALVDNLTVQNFMRYHENGTIRLTGSYHAGRPSGQWRWYDTSGNEIYTEAYTLPN